MVTMLNSHVHVQRFVSDILISYSVSGYYGVFRVSITFNSAVSSVVKDFDAIETTLHTDYQRIILVCIKL